MNLGTDLPVLVDTSVWIELLRHAQHPLRMYVENLIEAGRARLCSAIVGELLQGAKTPKDLEAAEALGESIPLLEATDATWLEAGRMGHRLRRKGVTVGLFDCYLAVLARRYGCAVLSLDKHFKLIAGEISLALDPRAFH